ncbi:MAG TPA: hypothetical protein VGR62_05815 [Candidatus Binatia bacterium]|jgi:hypothetical protein|nr:hypothetical protein [Candidatus Binatia bacterium]
MMLRLVAMGLLLAGPVWAHTASPETIVAEAVKVPGVEKAVRDEANPRVLIIRVGEAWFGLPEEKRREYAEHWRDDWRASVEQGVVSVLDARTEAPVVRFGAGGRVFIAPGGAIMNLQPGR